MRGRSPCTAKSQTEEPLTRTQRAGLLALAAAVLAAAFIVLRPGDGDDERAGPDNARPTTTLSGAGSTGTQAAPGRPSGPDAGPLLVPGTVRTITVSKGDTVRFRARSGEAEELHVHGYDILRELEPAASTRVSFTADIEGIFEIELERSGVQIGELRVEP